MPNPYESPRPLTESRRPLIHQLALWVCPWRLGEVSRSCSAKSAWWLGFIATSVQGGIQFSPHIGSISEPYKNLSECTMQTLMALPFTLVFATGLAFVVLTFARLLPAKWQKLVWLTPWSLSLFFVAWMVCHYCRVLNYPSYGIIDDDRPAWMTNELVVGLGSGWMYLIAVLLVLLSTSFVATDSNDNQDELG